MNKLPSSASTQLKFNFNFNFEAEIPLFPAIPATHPPTGKVVKWNKTSKTSIEDFKYFNWRLLILQLKSSNTCQAQSQRKFNSSSALTQLNLNSTQPQHKLLSLALLSSTCSVLLSEDGGKRVEDVHLSLDQGDWSQEDEKWRIQNSKLRVDGCGLKPQKWRWPQKSK